MKITIIHLLLCCAPVLSFAQKSSLQKAMPHHSNVKTRSGSWLDTSNMYPSRYGPVARLTQDNMPCILAYTPVKPIPNAGEKKETPGDIPNLWKKDFRQYHSQPRKQLPPTENLYTPKEYKAPEVWSKEKQK